MKIVRLHTVSVHIRSSSSLVIPVPIEVGYVRETISDSAEWSSRCGSLTPAQGDVLYRQVASHPDVVEQVRALAMGNFTDADLGDGDEEWPPHPDEIVNIPQQRAVRRTGGRVY
jgi:hypothetical protein